LKKRGDTIELIAENPDFQNIVLHAGRDEFSLEGIAVGLIRSSGLTLGPRQLATCPGHPLCFANAARPLRTTGADC
jgi:hypothetical protein